MPFVVVPREPECRSLPSAGHWLSKIRRRKPRFLLKRALSGWLIQRRKINKITNYNWVSFSPEVQGYTLSELFWFVTLSCVFLRAQAQPFTSCGGRFRKQRSTKRNCHNDMLSKSDEEMCGFAFHYSRLFVTQFWITNPSDCERAELGFIIRGITESISEAFDVQIFFAFYLYWLANCSNIFFYVLWLK